jgi:hypothetical protein
MSNMTLLRIAPRLILILAGAIAFSTPNPGQNTARLRIGGGTLDITFDAAPSPALRKLALGWITRAAKAVTVYYARFPVRHADIAIHLREGSGARGGRTSGDGGPHINVALGTKTTLDDLARDGNDWIMTHEMVHLALSSVESEHHWIEEGSATYVEPIARVRAGELTAEEVWRDMVKHMPQGQPAARDRGLDGTPTWGRTYWGGAIFCLLADVEIRKRTHNRMGLENALRGIIKAGGTIDTEWGLARVLAVGDKAIGVPVLQPLYDQIKASPTPVDLVGLWRQLGVEERDGVVIFHDDAPLADVRKAIMHP